MKETLFKLRVAQKMSVSELALVLDITEARVRGFEDGSVEPTMAELKKISIFYNLSVDEILGLKAPVVAPVKQEKKAAKAAGVEAASSSGRKPFCSRWFYIAVPVVFVVMMILMGLFGYSDEYYSGYYYYEYTVSIFDCFFTESAMIPFGVFMIISLAPTVVYMIVDMCLPKRLRAKLNLASALIFGAVGLLNFCLGVCFMCIFDAASMTIGGIMAYIFWLLISLYLIALMIWDAVIISKQTKE